MTAPGGRVNRAVVVALAIEAVAMAALFTIAADIGAHHRVETLGGVNMWGYRGGVIGGKQTGEIRIGLIGGNFAFGWGVAASETTIMSVRQLVALQTDLPGRPRRPIVAVNLAATGARARDYAAQIRQFAYLQPDLLCLLADGPETAPAALEGSPHRSGVFSMAGYMPALPLVLSESGSRRGGPLGGALRVTGSLLDLVDTGLRQLIAVDEDTNASYASSVADAASAALAAAGRVVVVLAPRATLALGEPEKPGDKGASRMALRSALAARFGGDPRVAYLDLDDAPAMHDATLRLETWSLSVAGHAKAAELILPAVMQLLDARL